MGHDCDDEETRATRIMNGSLKLSADEMFKELGYKNYEKFDITGNMCNLYGDNTDKRICFWKDKTIEIYDFYDGSRCFTLDELKAINKKCKEMGWI